MQSKPMSAKRWLLPNGIEDLLPDSAERLEQVRRKLLDLMGGWGYRLIEPPLVEFEDSLLTYSGTDYQARSLKATDPVTAKMLAIRPDITPQAARIDAHLMDCRGANRLCYIGSVLTAHSDNMSVSRNPVQLGAELFGVADIEADIEVLCLMVAALNGAGVSQLHLDLGHIAIFRGLARQAELSPQVEQRLFDAIQSKSSAAVRDLLAGTDMSDALKECFIELPRLHGSDDVLARAEKVLIPAHDEVHHALDELRTVAQQLRSFLPTLPLNFDLSELHGYHYHTGLIFAAYAPGCGRAIARGGRYDGIGKAFGRDRPATGFSADLKTLIELSDQSAELPEVVLAPWLCDPAVQAEVDALRRQGVCVVYLHGDDDQAYANGRCGRLVMRDDRWVVEYEENV